MKILVVRLSSFGDIVLTYPFINELRRLYPDSEISFLTKHQYADAAGLHPYVDKVISYNNGIKRIIRNSGFDVIFDLQKNQRTLMLLLLIGSKVYRVKKDTLKKRILATFKINLLKNAPPVYRRYINVLKKFDSKANDDYTKTEGLICDESNGSDSGYILVSPSSKHYTKRFPKERFLDILVRAGKKVVLTGDENITDKKICSYLEGRIKGSLNVCAGTSFGRLAGLIRNSDMVICNDSGVLHLAEALGKRTIVFFGSTVKEFGFYPQLETSVIYENKGLRCRPCTHIGRADCPKGHFKCMNEIDTGGIEKFFN